MLRLTLLLLPFLLTALAASCGSGPKEEAGSGVNPDTLASATAADTGTPAAATTDEVITGEARWRTRDGRDVQSLMGDPYTAMVVRVLRIALPYDPRPGYLGWTPSPCAVPPQHPKYSACLWTPSPEEALRPPGRPYTIYEAEVLRAMGSEAPAVGDHVYIRGNGGVWEGVAQHIEDDPLFDVGQTYLLAAVREDDAAREAAGAGQGYGAGAPFQRFVVGSDGKLAPVDPIWANMPAVQALSGRTVDEAKAIIESALAAASPTPAS